MRTVRNGYLFLAWLEMLYDLGENALAEKEGELLQFFKVKVMNIEGKRIIIKKNSFMKCHSLNLKKYVQHNLQLCS